VKGAPFVAEERPGLVTGGNGAAFVREDLRALLLPPTRRRLVAGLAVAVLAPLAIAGLAEIPHSPVDAVRGLVFVGAAAAAILVGRLVAGAVAGLVSGLLLAYVVSPSDEVFGGGGETAGVVVILAAAAVLLAHLLARNEAAREDAEASELRYRSLVEQLPLATYIVRYEDSEMLYVSPQVESILGCTVEQAVSEEDFWLERLHQDDRERVLDEWRTWRAGPMEEPFRCEYRMRADGDRVVWISDATVLVRTETGEPLHFQGYLLDVSESRQLEEQLRQSQKLEAIGRLAGGVAHDFNNLLSVITGSSDVLLARLERDDERRRVLEIGRASDRANELVRQLLAFSRRQVLHPQVVDVNGVVRGIEVILRRLIEEDIELAIDLEPALDHVEADPSQLEQVVMNLVVNARDAMPTGGRLAIETATVEIDAAQQLDGQLEPGRYSVVAVSDTGAGMDAETQARIFEPFFTTKEPGRGTGLGLSTVYGIVRQSGGSIAVSSEPGAGTTVRVYLPSTDKRAELAAEDAGNGAPEAGGSETVLLVEDEPMLRELMEMILTEAGYTILAAGSPTEALALAEGREGGIDLLISDVVMPRMSGPELAERLVERRPDLRVLYVSGYPDETLGKHGVAPRRITLIEKPFRDSDLRAKVREVLDAPVSAAPSLPGRRARPAWRR
jgi:two-component system cell cycle sensor histidine kinase/response regulator CckA